MQKRQTIDAEFVVITEADQPPAIYEPQRRERFFWLKVYWYLRPTHKKLMDAFWVGAYIYTAIMSVIEISSW